MKINKTIILSDIISIFIAFWLFIWIYMEMKCVIVINHRVLNVLFTQELRPLKSVYLNRNKCQREGATSLFNYTFPGIKQTCIDKNNEIVINKECDKPGYRLIKEIPAKNISIWRNKLICGDYYDFLSDTDFKLIGQNDLCSDEYKQCGFINTKTNTTGIHKKFCIKQELECPINFIEITNNISLYEYDEETYNLFPFDSDYYLVTSNKMVENSIIINIQISEGELPCYTEKRYSTTTSQFPSLNNIEKFKCMENQKNGEASPSIKDKSDLALIEEYGYDIRYVKFDSDIKENVLANNDLDYSYNQLPNTIDWKQDNYKGKFSLFYRDSYTVKGDCKPYSDIEKSVVTLTKIQSIRVLFALVHIFIYVMLFSILGLMKVVFSWYHSLLFGVKIAVSLIIFGANYIMIHLSKGYKESLSEINQLRDCLDEVLRVVIDKFDNKKNLEELNNFYLTETIMWGVYCFFNMIELIRLIHKIYIRVKNKYRRNIAKKEIGADNLIKIFEKVRGEIEKQRQKIKVS